MDVYVNAGAAADLTDILENQEADWYASFTDGIFERMTYDGKIMAVPTNFAAACVYYNTEMFADAGVEVPTTYDELIAACQKLQRCRLHTNLLLRRYRMVLIHDRRLSV